eukprot:763451-Hanusia_phi.AAC.1
MRLRDIERLLSTETSQDVFDSRQRLTTNEKKELQQAIQEFCSHPKRFFAKIANEDMKMSSETFIQLLTALRLYPTLLTGEDLCELLEKLIGLRGCFYSMHMLNFEEVKRALYIISETLQLKARCFIADTSFLTQTRTTLCRAVDSKLLYHRYSGCCRSNEPRVRQKPMKLRQDEFAMMMVDLRVVPESLSEEEVFEIFQRVWRERRGGASGGETIMLLDFEGYGASIREVARHVGVEFGDEDEQDEQARRTDGVQEGRERGRRAGRIGGRLERSEQGGEAARKAGGEGKRSGEEEKGVMVEEREDRIEGKKNGGEEGSEI